ncbi:hypothetical protein RF11_12631 [Thelohanellus kitauei]|uniref:Uncharacterized protein n=1 Tax=Thelohanellus kitauei TaxID=669202 RepID=A0A0C2NLH6_THEKT|nr:hypothetical protein RF11_12631 [Thelohanellus kitauei]
MDMACRQSESVEDDLMIFSLFRLMNNVILWALTPYVSNKLSSLNYLFLIAFACLLCKYSQYKLDIFARIISLFTAWLHISTSLSTLACKNKFQQPPKVLREKFTL